MMKLVAFVTIILCLYSCRNTEPSETCSLLSGFISARLYDLYEVQDTMSMEPCILLLLYP